MIRKSDDEFKIRLTQDVDEKIFPNGKFPKQDYRLLMFNPGKVLLDHDGSQLSSAKSLSCPPEKAESGFHTALPGFRTMLFRSFGIY